MTKLCRDRLSRAEVKGTKKYKSIASALLNGAEFDGIKSLSKQINISASSISRFAEYIGYPSYKHFSHEYFNEEVNIDVVSKRESNEELIEKISKKIKGDIYIISSRRGKSIGKFINERLNDGDVRNYYFHETLDDIDEYILRPTVNDTIILISLSGYSYIIKKALEHINKSKEKPNLIILTAEEWLDDFKDYDFISVKNIKGQKYNSDKWEDYNLLAVEVMKIAAKLLNNHMRSVRSKIKRSKIN